MRVPDEKHGALQKPIPPAFSYFGANPCCVEDAPDRSLLCWLGCERSTTLAELRPGEIVLIGSVETIDVSIAAKRVTLEGKIFGLSKNKSRIKAENVEVRRGAMNSIPLPDASIDVILSDCVVNRATDRDATLWEMFRVLKPGGRFGLSEVLITRPMNEVARAIVALSVKSLAGALTESVYRSKLVSIGFRQIEIEPIRSYQIAEDATTGPEADNLMSAIIRGVKPSGFKENAYLEFSGDNSNA